MANRSNVGGWLQGKTVRKGGSNVNHNNTSRMSSQVQSTSSTIFGGGVKDPTGRTAEYFSMDDQCPVCKSDRYLNPKLRLLVSSCYHKMCESCIDRLFTLGPAPCPICTKVLRKLAFTPQTFEDLGVEKEVAVRRRMAKDFNKRLEDFADLRAFNDYLEEVEEITFNLINDVDVAATEARIADYKAKNAAVIQLNLQREAEYAQALREQEEAARQEKELRAEEARLAEEAEREERDKYRREVIDRLETSDKDASKLVEQSRARAAKRNNARSATSTLSSSNGVRRAPILTIPDEPHIPYNDEWDAYESSYSLRDTYKDRASDLVWQDREGIMRAGGYNVEDAWRRAIMSAVAGLETAPLHGLYVTDAVVEAARGLHGDNIALAAVT